jgi:hypothetical protein
VVDTPQGEAFGFLWFELRQVHKRNSNGHFILLTPKKKARQPVKADPRHYRSLGRKPDARCGEADQRYARRMGALLPGWQCESCL